MTDDGRKHVTPHPSIVKAQLVGHTGPREVLVHLYGRCSNPVHDVSGTLPYRNAITGMLPACATINATCSRSRGRTDGLRGSSTAMRLQWIISTSTGPRRRLPRGPCSLYRPGLLTTTYPPIQSRFLDRRAAHGSEKVRKYRVGLRGQS